MTLQVDRYATHAALRAAYHNDVRIDRSEGHKAPGILDPDTDGRVTVGELHGVLGRLEHRATTSEDAAGKLVGLSDAVAAQAVAKGRLGNAIRLSKVAKAEEQRARRELPNVSGWHRLAKAAIFLSAWAALTVVGWFLAGPVFALGGPLSAIGAGMILAGGFGGGATLGWHGGDWLRTRLHERRPDVIEARRELTAASEAAQSALQAVEDARAALKGAQRRTVRATKSAAVAAGATGPYLEPPRVGVLRFPSHQE